MNENVVYQSAGEISAKPEAVGITDLTPEQLAAMLSTLRQPIIGEVGYIGKQKARPASVALPAGATITFEDRLVVPTGFVYGIQVVLIGLLGVEKNAVTSDVGTASMQGVSRGGEWYGLPYGPKNRHRWKLRLQPFAFYWSDSNGSSTNRTVGERTINFSIAPKYRVAYARATYTAERA